MNEHYQKNTTLREENVELTTKLKGLIEQYELREQVCQHQDNVHTLQVGTCEASWFDFESYVRFEIRFVFMVRFEIFESSALSIVIRKETIGGG